MAGFVASAFVPGAKPDRSVTSAIDSARVSADGVQRSPLSTRTWTGEVCSAAASVFSWSRKAWYAGRPASCSTRKVEFEPSCGAASLVAKPLERKCCLGERLGGQLAGDLLRHASTQEGVEGLDMTPIQLAECVGVGPRLMDQLSVALRRHRTFNTVAGAFRFVRCGTGVRSSSLHSRRLPSFTKMAAAWFRTSPAAYGLSTMTRSTRRSGTIQMRATRTKSATETQGTTNENASATR